MSPQTASPSWSFRASSGQESHRSPAPSPSWSDWSLFGVVGQLSTSPQTPSASASLAASSGQASQAIARFRHRRSPPGPGVVEVCRTVVDVTTHSVAASTVVRRVGGAGCRRHRRDRRHPRRSVRGWGLVGQLSTSPQAPSSNRRRSTGSLGHTSQSVAHARRRRRRPGRVIRRGSGNCRRHRRPHPSPSRSTASSGQVSHTSP